ncbi:MAG: tetratricopeptide repeat protein [Treponema sp.]|jgi:Flp pilus assembly protein TadD|nr:tetratricopeptide repeat protein [Treponema sp.]
MALSNPLDSLVFISLPESFSWGCIPGPTPEQSHFYLDPSIPLPVQKQPADDFALNGLTQEMIFAGILTVLAYDQANSHIDYYRNLLLAARPGIKQELGEAAILKARNENFEIAEELFASLRGLDPADMTAALNTAVMLDQRADYYRKSGLAREADDSDAEALGYYREAMDAEPSLPDAFFNAGFFYLKTQDFTQAQDCFETYLALESGTLDDGQDENKAYKIERAAEMVNTINAQNLTDKQFKGAYDLISKGEEEQGIKLVRQFLEKNPEVWNAWFLLGWGLRRVKRWQDAKAAFLLAVEHGASNADTYNELAICCMELEEFDGSEKYLHKALALENENTKIMSNMGMLALRRGKKEEALSWFLTVLEFDPSDILAKQMTGDSAL